jgi:DEAD/DEAH box helicase domain-containing protein
MIKQEKSSPIITDISFDDICKNSKYKESFNFKLYKHQIDTFNSLNDQRNVILISGTGSGKTEAWLIYSLCKNVKTLVIYPTKSLENDQFERIKKITKVNIVDKDNNNIDLNSKVILTNPAYLMKSIKSGKGKLIDFLREISLIVIDEFSFYDLEQAEILLELLKIINNEYSLISIAILTATLEKPNDLAKKLTEINGLETNIITGESYRSKNTIFIYKRKLNENEIIDIINNTNPTILVFVSSINHAETLKKKIEVIKSSYCETHHSRKSPDERKIIEDNLKNGSLNCVISPKTLEEGIDIGNIVSVVHIGLPEDPSNYFQREGRKGRRRNIKETFSYIIPWDDRDLLITNDLNSFNGWLSLGHLNYIFPKKNIYLDLFNLFYRYYRKNERNLEYNISNILKIYNNKKFKNIWINMQFYGYGVEPYRYYIDNVYKNLSISKSTYINYYLLGSLDLTYDAIVVNTKKLGRKKKFGGEIYAKTIQNINENDRIYPMIEAYNSYTKRYRRNIIDDMKYGRVFSVVDMKVYPPNGFGMIKFETEDVKWIAEIYTNKKVKVGDVEIVQVKYEEVASLFKNVGQAIHERYSYPTYGYKLVSYVPNAAINYIAASLLKVALRVYLKMSSNLISFYVNKSEINLWETNPSGIINIVKEKSKEFADYINKLDMVQILKYLSYLDKIAFYYALDNNYLNLGIEEFKSILQQLKYLPN